MTQLRKKAQNKNKKTKFSAFTCTKGFELSLYNGVFSDSLLSILSERLSFFPLLDTPMDIDHDFYDQHFGGHPSCILGAKDSKYEINMGIF